MQTSTCLVMGDRLGAFRLSNSKAAVRSDPMIKKRGEADPSVMHFLHQCRECGHLTTSMLLKKTHQKNKFRMSWQHLHAKLWCLLDSDIMIKTERVSELQEQC